MKTDRQHLLLCGALVCLSIAATGPVLEMGLSDDWSYTYIARELAATGRLRYYGWASAMVGCQAWFAALVIRIFGFSFTAVRLTTAVFAVASSLVLFGIGRRAGLNRSFATFGALSVLLSPLVIPIAASFMTDVPALFFLLACMYCGMRALETTETERSIFWLTAAAITGLLGGTVRQVMWGAPLSMLPVVAWLKRDDRRVAAAAVGLLIASIVAVAVAFQWLSRQPFFEWDPSPQNVREVLEIFSRPFRFAALLRTGLLFMLPVLVAYFVGWWPDRRWSIVIPGVLVLGALWAITQLSFGGEGFPYGNLVTRYGVLNQGTEAIGEKPVVLSRPALNGLWLLTLSAAGACVIALIHRSTVRPSSPVPRGSMRNFLLVVAPFSVGYLLILFYRTRFGDLFDRYLLPVLPVINLSLLWLYQQRVRDRVPVLAWLVLALFAGYGVAATHDYIAAARARFTAASALTAAGVPRPRITAGLEFDGWTEIEESGHINNALIKLPADAFRLRPYRTYPGGLRFRFWALTPSVDPEYFIVYSRQPGLVDAGYPPVSYTAWLPPRTRTVFTQRLE